MKKNVVIFILVLALSTVGVFADSSVGELPREIQIFEGFPDGELNPEDNLTRAQFARILVNCFETDDLKKRVSDFDDVSKNHWAYECICKAVEVRWLNGFPDGTFRPDDFITYEQAVSVICRILGIGSESNYPIGYLSAAMDRAITESVPLVIGDLVNLGQAQKIIMNALNYIEENEIFNNAYSSSKANLYMTPGFYGGGSGGGSAPLSEGSYYAMPYEPPMGPHNTEQYSATDENVFKNSITSPLSTFSIDTDTASYSNLRRFILNGQKIPKGSVRSEELINYFDYAHAQTDSEHPFEIKHTVARCPWNPQNELVMLTVSGEELSEPKPSNIVFLIDVSGSMSSYNKLPLVKRSLAMLLDELGKEDTISIVTYASGTSVALEATPATKKEKILETLDSLLAGGSTSGESGINLAYGLAEENKIDGNNRIILCTDGDFNIGMSSIGDLEELISQKRETGIYLSVLGFGMGNYKDNVMETLADKGNGNYAYIDNLREAKKVLVDDMSKTIYTIAKDVKIQVEFNPELVAEYRLVGYENRTLNSEDFANDTKDAGELGAGATVTVLYEIKPQTDEVSSELRYQSVITNGSDELMNVKIRYKNLDEDTSILYEYPILSEINENPDEDFMFVSAVAELGMILNDSEYKGTSTLESVMELAKSGIGTDKFGLRTEFLQLVDILKYNRR